MEKNSIEKKKKSVKSSAKKQNVENTNKVLNPKNEKNMENVAIQQIDKDDVKKMHIGRKLDLTKIIIAFLILLSIYALIVAIKKVYKSVGDFENFHSKSLKAYKYVSDKKDVLNDAYKAISEISNENMGLDPTNLNLAKINTKVYDDEDIKNAAISKNMPVPVTMEEEKKEEKSTAFQIYEKLQNKYQIFNTTLNNLCDTNPVYIVRQYHYDGYSIIGKYNPEDASHVKGKRHTWFIPHFSNVNIYYFDGDGNPITDDNNIKDIMSLASVYSYYKNPYDYKSVLKHCYNLFDKSYSYVASISEVYYCSGCMHYDNKDVATGSVIKPDTTLEKITKDHREQFVPKKDIPYKAGKLIKIRDENLPVNDQSYDDYIASIYAGDDVTTNNYCPGHIDLNLYVTVMTLDASRGLTSIDNEFGGRGSNYTKNWHGWDHMMINRARQLYYKDWEKEYGISISYINYVKPLTQEEINYYLNRLPSDITPNRKNLIKTALRSVGRIPYYYGGKTSRAGYDANMFGTKIGPDYKGRCLKGLDCSGWISWVFLTSFNKYIIKSEGTGKLPSEGTKITRKELKPGDLIIRPGIDSHVMMFLEWADDGKIKVIHENGSVNNVSIGTFDAYYPYYRRIINT